MITGINQQYSADMPQRVLEIPCYLAFSGNHEVIDKARKLLIIAGTCTYKVQVVYC